MHRFLLLTELSIILFAAALPASAQNDSTATNAASPDQPSTAGKPELPSDEATTIYPTILPTPPPAATPDQAKEMATILDHLTALYLKAPIADSDVNAAYYPMQPNGSYSWFNYNTRKEGYLPAIGHLINIRNLAFAYRNPQSPLFNKPELRAKIINGIDYWISKDPQAHQAFFMTVGVPRELDKILVLFHTEMTPEEIGPFLGMVRRGYRASDDEYLFEHKPALAENRLWIARAQFEAACVEGNYDYAQKAAKAIDGVIGIVPGEGLQADMSFHMHGDQLYNAGYGAGFCQDTIQLAYITRGTSFALSPDKLDLITRYLFDGQQWMIRGPQWDWNVLGRGIAFPDVSPITMNQADLPDVLDLAKEIAPAKAAEADAFTKRLKKASPPGEGAPQGNRMFWRSDYMVHARNDYRVGLKMYSTRTIGTEMGNGEGSKDAYHADGSFCLQKTGLEYDKIFALWNWRQVPGITCAQSDLPYPDITWGTNMRGTTSFVGGVSDGTYGAAAFDFSHEGITAHKASFFFDDEIVCLGAGINAANITYPINTTVEQNWHNGDVVSSASPTPLVAGPDPDLTGVKWVLHGTTGYIFPEKEQVHAQVETRTGSWHVLYPGRPESDVQTGDVFTLWIDHGVNPQNATYSYVVIPETSADKIVNYPTPAILANTPEQQAVWNDKLNILEALFYQAGTLALPNGITVTVDQPSALVARLSHAGWTISVSDPTQSQAKLNVNFGGKLNKRLSFDLPAAMEAGKSVSQSFTP